MDREREIIERQMAATRTNLTDKIGQLEQSVKHTVGDAVDTVEHVREAVTGTVNSVTDTLQSTVQSVTDSVRGTVESVSDALDVSKQVQKHPWGMMAGAAAVGFVGGCLLSSQYQSSSGSNFATQPTIKPTKTGNGRHAAGSSGGSPARFLSSSLLGSSADWSPLVEKLRGLAVGTALGVVKDLVSKSVPPALQREVNEVLDGVTTALGGHPITGHILPEDQGDAESRQQMAGSTSSAAESWDRPSRF